MTDYTVLRDLGGTSLSEPFGRPDSFGIPGTLGGGTRALGAPALGLAGVRIDVQQLDKNDVRDLSRDPEVRAIAPVMPTRLIHPVEEAGVESPTDTATTTVTWGVTAGRA